VLLEDHARLLLILHAVVGAATVAAATHLVVWMRAYPRGDFARHRSVRRFAWISVALFAAAFALGSLAYPTYKVRVRVGYLENPDAIAAVVGEERAPATIARTAVAARRFDVKEHWAGLGLVLALACALALRAWDPPRDGPGPATALFGFSLTVAAVAWLAALIGLVTASYRAIG